MFCVLKQHPTALCPPEYMVCFLHRLITAVRTCWDEGNRKSPGSISSEGTVTDLSVELQQLFDAVQSFGLIKCHRTTSVYGAKLLSWSSGIFN